MHVDTDIEFAKAVEPVNGAATTAGFLTITHIA